MLPVGVEMMIPVETEKGEKREVEEKTIIQSKTPSLPALGMTDKCIGVIKPVDHVLFNLAAHITLKWQPLYQTTSDYGPSL